MAEIVDKPLQRLGKSVSLGVMVDWVGDPYQMGILGGIADAAARAGAGLLCFVGGQLPRDKELHARHRVFELIGRRNVDGAVVVATTMMNEVGRDGVESYCKSLLQDMPYCSIGVELRGIPCVFPNNERGIEQAVSHLVQVHAKKRIAFVRGPLANEEAEHRHTAYIKTLGDHGIAFDPRLVATGNFMEASGREAVYNLAKVPGVLLKDLDAIVASNDSMAIGALNALTELGIAVPKTVALTGFDDVDEARLVASPLTTIRQPLEKIGRQAARNVLHWLQTGAKPDSMQIDTELLVRRSCGCSGNAANVRQSIVPSLDHSFEAALLIRRQHILDTLTRAARGTLGGLGGDWQPKLLNAFTVDMRGETSGAFGLLVEDFGQKLLAGGADVEVCHDVIDVLRRQLTITLRNEPVRRDKAETIFYEAHISLSEAIQRNMMRERLRLGRWVRDISYICNGLSGTFDLMELRNRVRDQLPRVGLKNYFVVAYSEEQGPRTAKYLVGADQGREVTPSSDNEFDASAILPKSLLESIGGRPFAVLPLTWKHVSLGHVLIELDLFHSFAYGPIAEAIGTGLYGARLAARR